MDNLDEITAKVTEDTSVKSSAVTLLTELKRRLDAAGTDPVKLKALSDELGASNAALAEAIAANTPAAE